MTHYRPGARASHYGTSFGDHKVSRRIHGSNDNDERKWQTGGRAGSSVPGRCFPSAGAAERRPALAAVEAAIDRGY